MRTSREDRLPTAGQTVRARGEESLEAWVRALPYLFLSNRELTRDVSAATKKGLLRSLGRRLYTTDVKRELPELTRAHALTIAALRCPGCVISHRSALEMQQADGILFLTGPKPVTERFPGLVLKVLEGPARLVEDGEFLGIAVSSRARAYLENLSYTRQSRDLSRSLSRQALEHRLELLLRDEGELGLNSLREQARSLAPQLGAERGLEKLEAIIGALLGTREDVQRSDPVAVARVDGLPYDDKRDRLFAALVEELLRHWHDSSRPAPRLLGTGLQNLAFIDAYFSNYIEGTRFEIDEAKAIVYEGEIPPSRPEDAHDIVGTFRLLMDRHERVSAVQAPTLEEFEYLLQRRHATIMRARPETRPGLYKLSPNRAGQTFFVAPELVRGTLDVGLRHFARLPSPFTRAVFMMFMITEVHPFDDGNGRLARVMMNAELVASGEHRIVIPTVYRPDYLSNLRVLSREADPRNFVRMLDYAHEYSSQLPSEPLSELIAVLEQTHAFRDEEGWVLRLPRSIGRGA